MVLSENIIKIIDQNEKVILSDVPFKDLLVDFKSAHILTYDEVKLLQKCSSNKETGLEFLEILKKRNNRLFFEFCEILKSSTVESIQEVGKNLQNIASNTMEVGYG